ncbi:hypothetical protein NJB1507_48630 [Mycobacterium marinum]|nr:hypothetical protein NJB1507_48630 [Mycobacterium marinum]
MGMNSATAQEAPQVQTLGTVSAFRLPLSGSDMCLMWPSLKVRAAKSAPALRGREGDEINPCGVSRIECRQVPGVQSHPTLRFTQLRSTFNDCDAAAPGAR